MERGRGILFKREKKRRRKTETETRRMLQSAETNADRRRRLADTHAPSTAAPIGLAEDTPSVFIAEVLVD